MYAIIVFIVDHFFSVTYMMMAQ